MKKRKIDPLEEIMSNPYYQLRDDYNYAEKVKGTISFGQYSMKYWALERDIVLDETKSEVTEEMFVKAIMDARKEGEILNDEDEVNGARKIRRKVISHMPSSKIDEEAASRLKQITGGDSINVPRKFRDDALLERRIKFVFSSNHPIIIDGEDDALLKRIIYLPFNYAIPDDQQDPDLGDKIWKERDAIATKALRYARKLVKLNYIFPEIPQMDNAKCIVRDSIAKTVGKFVQESCDKSESKAVTATEDLYNAYSDYCKEKNMWACSQKAFTKELTQMKIEHTRFRCTGEDMIARKNPVSAFKGIKLRP